MSVNSAGVQGDFVSLTVSTSSDGRFVAFYSFASNLVLGDTNSVADIFVRDRQSGITERVSVSTGGFEGDDHSRYPSISADARFVAFDSYAWNLASGDFNGFLDVFVHDRQSGTTERVSESTGGAEGDGPSEAASISADGRFVAFASQATNLVAGDTNGVSDIFVRDRQTGTTERVSVSTGAAQGSGHSGAPSISADGRFIAFSSSASNLVAGDTNLLDDIFVHDRQSGTTERVNVSTSGLQAGAYSSRASISADGRFIAFSSQATNLVAGDTNTWADIFVHDRQSGTTERVSVATSGAQGDSESLLPSISGDGRFIAFSSGATNLVAGDSNAAGDVFLRDRQAATTELLSVDFAGAQGNSTSWAPSISTNGHAVAFVSEASNLVAGDTNGFVDAFVRDRSISQASPFCFGDGSGTPCPCGNASATGNGCASSVNASGANLAASGLPSLSADTLTLLGSGMPNSSALYFQGTTQVAAGAGTIFGDGLRCAGGTIVRLGPKTNVGGSSQYPAAGDPSVSLKGGVVAPGQRTYQIWYRNAAPFCTPSTFNLTNGLTADWAP